jgi:integrase
MDAERNHACSGLRAEILRKIELGTFKYGDYFPEVSAPASSNEAGVGAGGQLLETQLEVYRTQVKNRRCLPARSPATRSDHRQAHAVLGQGALAEATPSKLRDWIGGFGITAKAARNMLTPLRSVFEDALNDELIAFNPFDRIALASSFDRQQSRATMRSIPSRPRSADACSEHARADERPMLQFWFNTGLRPANSSRSVAED